MDLTYPLTRHSNFIKYFVLTRTGMQTRLTPLPVKPKTCDIFRLPCHSHADELDVSLHEIFTARDVILLGYSFQNDVHMLLSSFPEMKSFHELAQIVARHGRKPDAKQSPLSPRETVPGEAPKIDVFWEESTGSKSFASSGASLSVRADEACTAEDLLGEESSGGSFEVASELQPSSYASADHTSEAEITLPREPPSALLRAAPQAAQGTQSRVADRTKEAVSLYASGEGTEERDNFVDVADLSKAFLGLSRKTPLGLSRSCEKILGARLDKEMQVCSWGCAGLPLGVS